MVHYTSSETPGLLWTTYGVVAPGRRFGLVSTRAPTIREGRAIGNTNTCVLAGPHTPADHPTKRRMGLL